MRQTLERINEMKIYIQMCWAVEMQSCLSWNRLSGDRSAYSQRASAGAALTSLPSNLSHVNRTSLGHSRKKARFIHDTGNITRWFRFVVHLMWHEL